MRVGHKLMLLVALALLAVAAAGAAGLLTLRSTLRADKEDQMRAVVDVAWSIVAQQHAAAEAGRLTDSAAQAQALQLISGLRYRGDEYFWVNDMQPYMLLHPSPVLQGHDVGYLTDPDGVKIMDEMVQRVRESGAGYVAYRWPRPQSSDTVPKLAYVRGFAPWGWVVGSGVYIDDIDARFHAQARTLLGLLAVAALLLLGVSAAIVRGITRPLAAAQARLGAMAEGDFRPTPDAVLDAAAAQADELGRMAQALLTMREHARRLLGQVQATVAQVNASVTQLAASARQIEASAAEQAAATQTTAGTAQAIAAGARQTAVSMETLNRGAQQAGAAADAGTASLSSVQQALRQMDDAVAAVAGRLAEINDRAGAVAQAITLVTKVAEQTNLLSLNASIEAEKAGEAGRGFAVVAREIRRLADRSAVAAVDITRLAGEMKTAVAAGVMGMDQFTAQMRAGSEEIGRLTGHLGGVMGEVNGILGQLGDANQGAQTQAQRAAEIARAMHELTEAAEQTMAALRESAAAVTGLNGTVQALQQEVATFRMQD